MRLAIGVDEGGERGIQVRGEERAGGAGALEAEVGVEPGLLGRAEVGGEGRALGVVLEVLPRVADGGGRGGPELAGAGVGAPEVLEVGDERSATIVRRLSEPPGVETKPQGTSSRHTARTVASAPAPSAAAVSYAFSPSPIFSRRYAMDLASSAF